MSVQNSNELKEHLGHHLEIATYGDEPHIFIECMDCNEVLLELDEKLRRI